MSDTVGTVTSQSTQTVNAIIETINRVCFAALAYFSTSNSFSLGSGSEVEVRNKAILQCFQTLESILFPVPSPILPLAIPYYASSTPNQMLRYSESSAIKSRYNMEPTRPGADLRAIEAIIESIDRIFHAAVVYISSLYSIDLLNWHINLIFQYFLILEAILLPSHPVIPSFASIRQAQLATVVEAINEIHLATRAYFVSLRELGYFDMDNLSTRAILDCLLSLESILLPEVGAESAFSVAGYGSEFDSHSEVNPNASAPSQVQPSAGPQQLAHEISFMGGWMNVDENSDFYNLPAHTADDHSFFDQI